MKVNDKMQKGYVYWKAKPMGRDFRLGFNPDLTPKQMLALGLAGKRFGSIRKIRVAGSNGTAVIIRDDVVGMIYARLPDGVECDVMLRNKRTLRASRSIVGGAGNARRCCTGLTIPEKYKQFGIGGGTQT